MVPALAGSPAAGVASRAGHAGRGADVSQTLSLSCDFHRMVGLNPGTAMLKHQHRLAGLPDPWAAVAGLAEGVSQLGETGSPPHLHPPPALQEPLEVFLPLPAPATTTPGLGSSSHVWWHSAPLCFSWRQRRWPRWSMVQMNADALLGRQRCPPGWVLAGTSWAHSCPGRSPPPPWHFCKHAHLHCPATDLTRGGCSQGWVLLGMGAPKDRCCWG